MKDFDPNVLILAEAIGKFFEIQKQVLSSHREQVVIEVREALSEFKAKENKIEEKEWVYGLKGLAKIIGCSKSKAARIKASGVLDSAIEQNGNIIRIDAKLAEELYFKKNAE